MALWGARCDGAMINADEVCNGLDDDCDGIVDEGDFLFNQCVVVELPRERCDGRDNDCDDIDEPSMPGAELAELDGLSRVDPKSGTLAMAGLPLVVMDMGSNVLDGEGGGNPP